MSRHAQLSLFVAGLIILLLTIIAAIHIPGPVTITGDTVPLVMNDSRIRSDGTSTYYLIPDRLTAQPLSNGGCMVTLVTHNDEDISSYINLMDQIHTWTLDHEPPVTVESSHVPARNVYDYGVFRATFKIRFRVLSSCTTPLTLETQMEQYTLTRLQQTTIKHP